MPAPLNYLDLLSPSQRMKPRFCALTEAVLSQAMDLFALLDQSLTAFSLEEAVGKQLDTLGALCGVPRPSAATSDEDYRLLLRARIAAHHWNGSNETLPEALSFAFPGRNAKLRDNQDGTVTAFWDGGSLPFPPEELFPRPAGIRLIC